MLNQKYLQMGIKKEERTSWKSEWVKTTKKTHFPGIPCISVHAHNRRLLRWASVPWQQDDGCEQEAEKCDFSVNEEQQTEGFCGLARLCEGKRSSGTNWACFVLKTENSGDTVHDLLAAGIQVT